MVDERALEDDQPICDTCRARSTGIDMDGIESYAKLQIALAKAGVKSVDELTPVQRSTMIALGILPNEIEVDEPE